MVLSLINVGRDIAQMNKDLNSDIKKAHAKVGFFRFGTSGRTRTATPEGGGF